MFSLFRTANIVKKLKAVVTKKLLESVIYSHFNENFLSKQNIVQLTAMKFIKPLKWIQSLIKSVYISNLSDDVTNLVHIFAYEWEMRRLINVLKGQ